MNPFNNFEFQKVTVMTISSNSKFSETNYKGAAIQTVVNVHKWAKLSVENIKVNNP